MRSTSWIALCVFSTVVCSCSKKEPAGGADEKGKDSAAEPAAAAQPAPSTPKPTEPADAPSDGAAAKATAGDTPVGDREDLAEVEIFGTIKGVPKQGNVVILAAIGDCLADDANVLDKVAAGENFTIEVFAPQGSDLTVCAAVEPGDGKPSVLYGKWKDSLHAEGEGEVEFEDLAIELKKGKPHTFPVPAHTVAP